ncbi:MT-A70-domain-containing protein [Saitoella complicata NRRL Y-17804]|uniref:MT-A70-domain-containing protein n=1 Tax=Saitoella complicata (strain BCRC 22490 / CBS 7301 / JCM 7358 / NBRC 10748 / NRRL Y-17804) TaxID=698492 RepID=A0A0E9NBF5_SAICN|nr:MT-A70-domain-containing protein [Saitoella complicata NRRL Y-17804]ODQ55307.1 MT-A70-domain-containing protein [Saitoella complicata NRRL Y-17804]GAO47138.1 hypothetical protein G7K_1349-t1 [Saitoella complicata NRRL Y-17804]
MSTPGMTKRENNNGADHDRLIQLLKKRSERRRAKLDLPSPPPAPKFTPQPPPPSQAQVQQPQILIKDGSIINDYSLHFVQTSHRPQSYIRNATLESRFEGYPKLARLARLKQKLVEERAHPPMSLRWDEQGEDLRDVLGVRRGVRFDVVVIDATSPEHHPEQLFHLPVPDLISTPSFLYIWVNTPCLETGRQLLTHWGFRRAEDVVWCKTTPDPTSDSQPWESGPFVSSKVHCLMGIKGTVRRSTDTHLIHCNVDTDTILAPSPPPSTPHAKPTELYHIIENFCLGRRRLEIFATDASLRRGWVSVGREMTRTTWDVERWLEGLVEGGTGSVVGFDGEIEMLRPKSPVPKGQQHMRHGMGGQQSQQMGMGAGMMQPQQGMYMGGQVAIPGNGMQMPMAMPSQYAMPNMVQPHMMGMGMPMQPMPMTPQMAAQMQMQYQQQQRQQLQYQHYMNQQAYNNGWNQWGQGYGYQQ